MELDKKNILLGYSVKNKKEAIQIIAAHLEKQGAVAKGYDRSMLAREEESNTYLGSGVAIPHCQFKGISLVRATSVVLLQAPQGVLWNKKDPQSLAYIICGIASNSDAHLPVLERLTELLSMPETLEQLRLAKTTDEFAQKFTG